MNLNKKSIAMVFDVETTGLLRWKNGTIPKLDVCPWVLQCSYIIYDVGNLNIIKAMNSYVKIPDEVIIPAASNAIHGITRAQCDAGRSMRDILTEFYTDCHTCVTVLVAHNYKFDSRMLDIEFRRNWPSMKDSCPFALNLFHPDYMRTVNITNICTMDSTINVCKIPFGDKGGNVYTGKAVSFKWPTLMELYIHLFHETPDNLHDSMMDCLVCLRSLLKVSGEYNMEKEEFVEMVLLANVISLRNKESQKVKKSSR
jgi:DNA polymerase III epsilon subunit-like protein